MKTLLAVLVAVLVCHSAVGQFLQRGNHFSSGINIGSEVPLGVCNESNSGTLYYLQGSQGLLLCNGSEWTIVSVAFANQEALRDFVLCSGHGTYDYESGLCACVSDDSLGHWGGNGCHRCLEGYSGAGCTNDVDECAVENGGCEYFCANTVGSFACSCPNGYQLDVDELSCVDVTDPVVVLDGPQTLTLSTGSIYFEYGYSATDNSNDTLVLSASSNVNMQASGTYAVTYSAEDGSGNAGTATRTVVVTSGATYTAMYASHMVLQRSPETPCVQGFYTANANVQLYLNDALVGSATADGSGQFSVCVSLDSSVHGYGPHLMYVVGANGARNYLEDIMLGDVFVCSGQSNMEQMLSTVFNASIEYGFADSYGHNIRLMKIQQAPTGSPVTGYAFSSGTFAHEWQRASSSGPLSESSGSCCNSVTGFSGVCWTFGRKLYELRGQTVPIGLVDSNYGGTTIERWSTAAGLSSCGASGTGDLYNGMIHPLQSYSVTGAIWYQGESNSGNPVGYECLHSALVEEWRQTFGNDMSFAFVQLAGYEAGSAWPEFRLSQMKVLELSKTGMATAIDLGERVCETPPLCVGLIHPRQKRPVGERLALTMNGVEYGGSEEYHGPTVSSYQTYNVEYDNVGGVRFSFELVFDYANYGGLGTHGTFDCSTCCSGGAISASVGGDPIPESAIVVSGNRVSFNVTSFVYGDATIDVKHAHSAFPQCVLHDDAIGIAAPPFHILLTPGDPCADPSNSTAFSRCDGGSWDVLYDLDIPVGDPKTAWATFADIPYSVDNSALFDSPCGNDILRVGYHLQLDDTYGFVSMAPFSSNTGQYGVPIDWSFQQLAVSDLFFASNAQTAVPITWGSSGTLEFWPNCYSVGDDGVYDSTDTATQNDCYGSMQIHDANGATMFAFNRWASASTFYDIGVGVSPSGEPDWTFSVTSQTHSVRRLRVFVQRAPAAPVTAVSSCDAVLENSPSATSGTYSLTLGPSLTPRSVYCDMDQGSTYGPGFARVYYHDASIAGAWGDRGFNSDVSDPTSASYAILSNLADFRGVCGLIEMRMDWPGESEATGFNRWTQLSNPVTDAHGALPIAYQPLDVQYTVNAFGGLQRSLTSSSLLDGTLNPLQNWYYAVGSRTKWQDIGAPGPNTPVARSQLWARPYIPTSCKEYADHGFAASQVYDIRTLDGVRLSVYCDMSTLGGGWTRIGYQDIQQQLWPSSGVDFNVDDPSAVIYSIFGHLENFRRSGKFEFLMRWPGHGTFTGYAQWTQTSNPIPESPGTAPSGYVGIRLDHSGPGSNVFGGLMKSTSSAGSFLDGIVSPIANWYFAFGGRSLWNGGIPGPSAVAYKVEVLVR